MAGKASSQPKHADAKPGNSGSSSVLSRIKGSLSSASGEIIFGMEDGLVSIFGLVFGVAATASSAGAVLTAGVAGAAAAAVSMGAGTWLDKQSTRSHARWQIQQENKEVKQDRGAELDEERRRLLQVGFSEAEARQILGALNHDPKAMKRFEAAYELNALGDAQLNPVVHAIWMFVADVVAAGTPVAPYAFLNLGLARIVSTSLAIILLIALGIGRARYAHQPLWSTILITLGIGGGAAAAGVLFGRLFG